MIPIGNTPVYRLVEEKGKYGLCFGKSPVMPITIELHVYLSCLEKGQTIIVKADEAGIEGEFTIVEYQLNSNPTYPNGILLIFVTRANATLTVTPHGRYKRGEISKPTNPCGEEPITNWKGNSWTISDIMSVQPMTQPSAQIFYLDFKYNEPNKNGDVFTEECVKKAMKEWNDRHLPSKYKT